MSSGFVTTRDRTWNWKFTMCLSQLDQITVLGCFCIDCYLHETKRSDSLRVSVKSTLSLVFGGFSVCLLFPLLFFCFCLLCTESRSRNIWGKPEVVRLGTVIISQLLGIFAVDCRKTAFSSTLFAQALSLPLGTGKNLFSVELPELLVLSSAVAAWQDHLFLFLQALL